MHNLTFQNYALVVDGLMKARFGIEVADCTDIDETQMAHDAHITPRAFVDQLGVKYNLDQIDGN